MPIYCREDEQARSSDGLGRWLDLGNGWSKNKIKRKVVIIKSGDGKKPTGEVMYIYMCCPKNNYVSKMSRMKNMQTMQNLQMRADEMGASNCGSRPGDSRHAGWTRQDRAVVSREPNSQTLESKGDYWLMGKDNSTLTGNWAVICGVSARQFQVCIS